MSLELEARDAPFRLTAPIESIQQLADGTLLVHTVVTSEAPDNQRGITRDGQRYDGEIIDYDAAKRAAPGLMEWPSLKEMHDQDTASGTVLRLQFDDAARRVEGDLHVVDPVAVKKVLAKVYKAVSIGGYKRASRLEKAAGHLYRRVVELIWDEISLVDRPANKDAHFSAEFVLAKRDLEEPAVHPADDRSVQQIAIDEARVADPDNEPLAKKDEDPDVGGGGDRDKIPAEDFAGKNRSFPIVTPGDVSDAASSIGRAGDGNYSSDELKANIIRIAKRKGAAFEAELPKAWRDDDEGDEKMAKAADPVSVEATAPADAVVGVGPADASLDEPLAKADPEPAEDVADADPSAAPAPAVATALEPLRKYANGVVLCLQGALSQVTEAIACEAAEGDSADVEALTAIANALQECLVKEASEPPSPAEQLAAAADALEDAAIVAAAEAPVELVEPFALSYARIRARSAIGEFERLAKAGKRNSSADQGLIDQMHDLTVELGTTSHAAPAGDEGEAESDDEPLAKAADPSPTFTDQIIEALRGAVPASKLEAIEQRLAAIDARSTAQGETLERIAKAEAGGGPLAGIGRLVMAAERGEVTSEGGDRATVLARAAELVDDPSLKSELGNRAALVQIQAARRGA